MINKFDCWLFDIDDTLIDFKESQRKSLEGCHRRFFSQIDRTQFYSDYTGINHGLWKQAERGSICPSEIGRRRFVDLSEEYGMEFDENICTYYEQELIDNSAWIEGAEAFLENLKAANIKIGFVTNGFAHIQHSKFKNLNLGRFSSVLVISEEFGKSKPDRAIFDHALEKIGGIASRTLVVGDSLTSDGKGARNAQMYFCWYNPARKDSQDLDPDYTLSDYSSIGTAFSRTSLLQ